MKIAEKSTRSIQLQFQEAFDSRTPDEFRKSSANKLVKQLFSELSIQKPLRRDSSFRNEFFNRLDAMKQEGRLNGYSVLQAKETFDDLFLSEWNPELADNYRFFKQAPKEVYKTLSPMRQGTNFVTQKAVGGAVGVACAVYQKDPKAKISLLIAANSGLPGGAVGSELNPYKLSKSYRHVLEKNLNAKTQEESVISAIALSGMSKHSEEEDRKESVRKLMLQLHGKWGMLKPVKQSKDTMTKQGIDFRNTTSAKDYANVHAVKGPFTVSPLVKNQGKKSVESDNYASVDLLVFADSVNANPKIGSAEGSMQRTCNRLAAKDYAFFKQCVVEKLRASLDAMAEAGITHALLATISAGIYAGQHQEQIRQEFPLLLNEVLNEEVGPNGEKRGSYFQEVIIPQLA